MSKPRVTVENGEERDVNEETDYLCDECSTELEDVYHEKAV